MLETDDDVFSMPCAQKPQTRPLTVISIVVAFAVAASPRPAINSSFLKVFMRFSSKIEHDHGLQLAVLREADFDPGIALE